MTRTPRRHRRRLALLAAGLLAPALIALLAAARPAPAAQQPARPAGPAARPAAGAQLDALVKPASAAAPAGQPKGVCNLPGVGDIGELIGLCGSGSGIAGDIEGSNPPVPEPPDQSISSMLQIAPARPPAPAAAFGPHAASTEFDQYGYAGLSWSDYDLSLLSAGIPGVETFLGNWEMSVAKVIVATDNTLHSLASSPSWMTALIPIVTGSTSTLYKTLFLTWAGIALLCVAISVVFRAHRSDTPGAVTLAAWAVLVLTLVSGAVAAPAWAGEQAQSLMGSTLSLMDAGFAGPGSQASAAQAHDSLLVQSVLYPAWVRGELGDPSSATAQKYGPLLLENQALTWAQASGTPAQVAAVVAGEQAAWTNAAAQVQKTDPVAYQVLTGDSLDRMGAGFLALVTALIVCTFDVIASLMVIAALLAVLAGTVLLPAVGVAGLHYRLKNLVTDLGSQVLRMLLNAVVWAAAAGVDQVATRALLTQNVLPLPLTLLLLAGLPIALWLLTRRLRGRQAVPPAARKLVMMGLGYKLLRGGARRGAQDALEEAGPAGAFPPGGDWLWRAQTAWPTGSWTRTPPLGPVPPGTVPPAPPAPPMLPPAPPVPPGPNGNGSGPRRPRGGGKPWRPQDWRIFRPPPGGPREYTGGGDSSSPGVLSPTDVFGPGENYDGGDLDDAGLYHGGA